MASYDYGTMDAICSEIVQIMETYDRQMVEDGDIGTPGGLEHMGDVWSLLRSWSNALKDADQEEKE